MKLYMKIHPSFWNELYHRKLNIYKLNTDWQTIYLNYKDNSIDINSFSGKGVPGILITFNTIEDFNNYEYNELFDKMEILNGKTSNPLNLFKFVLLVFPNLKTFKFTYKIGIPTYKNVITGNRINTDHIRTIIENQKFDIFQQPLFMYMKNRITSLKQGWHFKNHHECCVIFNDVNDTGRIGNVLMYLKKHNGEILGSDVNIMILRGDAWKYMNRQYEDYSVGFTFDTSMSLSEKMVGWKDVREIDLSGMLDSKALMNQAVNLNLNLMKWRSWPDLTMNEGKKCLLFGAGTLGCSVARNLMGWGFKDIVFIDNGDVSLSNPVRQCLFEYSDYGKPKATCAAEALMRIYPDMNATGHVLSIPMPGHSLVDFKDLEKVIELVKECDIAFLLTDSRESRWLPIVLCKYLEKILVNVALGFDSYLIDHNFREDNACYFCNDIVAARNSTRNRTVDQQCSVTRPGLSMMASSLAVEMLVSHLNGKDVPRHVRGSLAEFSHKNMKTSRFPNCTACSEMIINEYNKRKNDFICDICDNPEQLEKISGITELMRFKDIEEDI